MRTRNYRTILLPPDFLKKKRVKFLALEPNELRPFEFFHCLSSLLFFPLFSILINIKKIKFYCYSIIYIIKKFIIELWNIYFHIHQQYTKYLLLSFLLSCHDDVLFLSLFFFFLLFFLVTTKLKISYMWF